MENKINNIVIYVVIVFALQLITIGLIIDSSVNINNKLNPIKTNNITIKPEYILEITSNDSVLIQSDNIIYKCHYKDIQKTIDKDNL